MTCLAIALQPSELLEAWRQETGRLLLPAPQGAGLREKAAVRIQLEGKGVVATVVGTVVSAHQDGRGHRIELAPDAESLRAIRLLSAAARGESIRFLNRPPRYRARLPAFVDWEGARVYMATFSVSEAGCGLLWSGSLPTVGHPLHLRLGAGPHVAEFRGVVCWVRSERPNATVGVRLIAGRSPGAVWQGLLLDARRSGAPT
jgi:hypothetical protein